MILTLSVTVLSRMVSSNSTGTPENGKTTTTSQNVSDHSWTRFRHSQRYVQTAIIAPLSVTDGQYLTNSVNRRLLTLFSRVLELDDDYLWNNVQSHVEGSATGEGYFRHAIFRPVEKATQEAAKGLKMHGHTDFGLTTLLFSVPISCLQIWKDDQWVYVPYKPGCLVVNIGETLEIVSGGHFKATKHRVYKPPADQAHEERLSIVQFNSSVGDLRMTPAAGE
jgi:isopenicillin N synthase-like dioxygenase